MKYLLSLLTILAFGVTIGLALEVVAGQRGAEVILVILLVLVLAWTVSQRKKEE